MKYVLIAALLFCSCRKEEKVSVCDTVNPAQELSGYIQRYCTQVILEYYMMHDQAAMNAYFGTEDLLDEYAGNSKFQALVAETCRRIDRISTYQVGLAGQTNTCTYEGIWRIKDSDWNATGKFTYDVSPKNPEYRYWRIETDSFIAGIDAYIIQVFKMTWA